MIFKWDKVYQQQYWSTYLVCSFEWLRLDTHVKREVKFITLFYQAIGSPYATKTFDAAASNANKGDIRFCFHKLT